MSAGDPGDLVRGPDGLLRCSWATASADYAAYHDTEWGVPVHGDDAVFERIVLESFQSGLSWLVILRKRPAFRAAFAGFSIPVVAGYGPAERARLLADAGIVRNRAKVDATLANARAAAALIDREGPGALDRLVWSHAPPPAPPPERRSDLAAATAASRDLAAALKRAGMTFVGPTTAYAAMQALGLVDDHLAGCHARRRSPAGR